jgi:SAM-dependent MidA family methyltransferase
MLNQQELIKQQKHIITRINKIISHLQSAKKSAKSGNASIDNELHDAAIELILLQKFVYSLWSKA